VLSKPRCVKGDAAVRCPLFILAMITPYITDAGYGNLQAKITFVWAGAIVLFTGVVFFFVPETKGLSIGPVSDLYASQVAARRHVGRWRLCCGDLLVGHVYLHCLPYPPCTPKTSTHTRSPFPSRRLSCSGRGTRDDGEASRMLKALRSHSGARHVGQVASVRGRHRGSHLEQSLLGAFGGISRVGGESGEVPVCCEGRNAGCGVAEGGGAEAPLGPGGPSWPRVTFPESDLPRPILAFASNSHLATGSTSRKTSETQTVLIKTVPTSRGKRRVG
jgi:hypothetical protein